MKNVTTENMSGLSGRLYCISEILQKMSNGVFEKEVREMTSGSYKEAFTECYDWIVKYYDFVKLTLVELGYSLEEIAEEMDVLSVKINSTSKDNNE